MNDNEGLILYPKDFSFLKRMQGESLALGRTSCMNKVVKE